MRRTPLKRKAPRSVVPFEVREAVRRRSGGRCEVDGCPVRAAHMHHKLPRSAGGPHTVDNLLDVCNSCHSWIHAHPMDSYTLGLLERRS